MKEFWPVRLKGLHDDELLSVSGSSTAAWSPGFRQNTAAMLENLFDQAYDDGGAMKELVQVADLQVASQAGALALPPPIDVAKNVGCDQKDPATLSAAIYLFW